MEADACRKRCFRPLNLDFLVPHFPPQGGAPPASSSLPSDISLLPLSLERRMGLAVLSISGKTFLACVDCPKLTLLDCGSVKRHLDDHKHQMVAPFDELLSRLQELGVCDLKVSYSVRLVAGRFWVSLLSLFLRHYHRRLNSIRSLTSWVSWCIKLITPIYFCLLVPIKVVRIDKFAQSMNKQKYKHPLFPPRSVKASFPLYLF